MRLLEIFDLTDMAPMGYAALAVAVVLGILAPALCRTTKARVVLLAVCVVLTAALAGLLQLLGTVALLRVPASVLTPFTLGLLVGTLIQLVRTLVKKSDTE
jgi:hypothetical protein